MEEEKAAAYYKELSEKGSGAARFKQGLGFSDNPTPSSPPPRGSAFLTNFVKASSPSHSSHLEKQSQILNIQNKLKKKPPSTDEDVRVRVSSRDRDRDRHRDRHRSRSRERESRRYRSSSRERRDRDRDRRRDRRRSRSLSPPRRHSERGSDDGGRRKRGVLKKDGNGVLDYANLIHGYHNMTPAEKVKAKMKLQLSQTAENDEEMGAGSQWERFDFNKDAPVEDEEHEAADDDAAVSKRIGQSFRFASLEGKREDEIRNAHDLAMFGVPAPQPSQIPESEDESENGNKLTNDTKAEPASSLLNEKVLSKQQGSWRDRARRNVG
ncbi:uncharacterized protein LOC141609436 [Silene latifolia]|uniref:uncharacterized protein LOC141609436 n=1 Tax=Silene latifolia TaxID=37657 RepID=UPI003D7830D5